MEKEPQRVVCQDCGTVLVEGKNPEVKGLCDSCKEVREQPEK